MIEKQRPQVFEYTDYRLFLGDLYEHLKQTTSYFSYRYFSKKAGFKSPNYLKLVIEGKRNISKGACDQFSTALKLNKNESQFFCSLVAFNQAKNNDEKSKLAVKLLSSKIYQKLNPLKEEQLNYYRHWYFIALRELTLCPNFKNDPEWIAKHFHNAVTPHQIKEALKALVRMGLLEQKTDGNLVACDKNLTTFDEVTSSLVAIYHREMLDQAKESIDYANKEEREISSICVPVSEETFEKMKGRIQEFRKELIAMADGDQQPDKVYQMNFQLFPVTKKLGDVA